MNKILILYEHLASWCPSVCKKGNLWCVYHAAPYPSTALSVVLYLGSVGTGQLCWKNSFFGQGYTEATLFQRKDPTSVHKHQFFLSDLGKKQWLPATSVSAVHWHTQVVNRCSLESWDLFVSRWNSTGVHEDIPHPSLKLCGLGHPNTYTKVTDCKSPSVIMMIESTQEQNNLHFEATQYSK